MKPVMISGVSKRFGDFVAVDSVDLAIQPGEIVGLLGANGAGKTTLIRMILGLLRPTAGEIKLFGQQPSRRERRRIGYVPQNLGLYRDLTVPENLEFRGEAFGVDPSQIASPNNGVLVDDLSLGAQRRAAFAAATQHRPQLLVLDEPTSGVSPLSRTKLWNLIRDRAEDGVAVLVSTHYMDEAEQADRLVLMSRGRVAAEGSLGQILGDRMVVEVTADRWTDAFELLDRRSRLLTLSGTQVRIIGESEKAVRDELVAAGVPAGVRSVPATLDETMVVLDA